MHFPERIQSINSHDRVLDIGPGPMPHPRADVALEKRFDAETAYAQRGYTAQAYDPQKTVFYDGGTFPFSNREFDYVICSHVLEHIPPSELDLFISELQRVAPRGYLEFPSVFYELICFPEVHMWFMNHRDDTIYLMDKSIFRSNFLHRTYRELFYGSDNYMFQSFFRYPEFYFCGFEWERSISYQLITEWDELVNGQDFKRFQQYFSTQGQTSPQGERPRRHLVHDGFAKAIRVARKSLARLRS